MLWSKQIQYCDRSPQDGGWTEAALGGGGRGSLSRQLTFWLPVNEKEPTLGRAETREQHIRRSWGRKSLASSRKCQDPARLELGSGEGVWEERDGRSPTSQGVLVPVRSVGLH